MTPLDVLYAVRSLLAKPERWFQGGIARAEDDRKVSITHPHATKFSLDGAFHRVHHITKATCGPAYEIVKYCIDRSRCVPVSSFNDARGTTHWTVTQMLDRAILMAGGEPPLPEEEE